ncbi:MAG: hypothetical protein J0L61_13285 [Planctomycetes bacterium]|nr:hypothetical protein [Planctomycetota bacterium]
MSLRALVLTLAFTLFGCAPRPEIILGGHINCLGHPPHQYVTFYIMVDDVDASLAEIAKRGGSMLVPKMEVPGMGWFAWFKDPEGNAVGLWKSMMQ